MSANVPEMLDAWRMVAARRRFDGQVPLAELTRLQGLVADTDGECRFALEFGRDEVLRVSYVELSIDTALPLTCQRSLQRFLLPVSVVQRLGLIRDEEEESSLPPDYEALLVPEDGNLRPLDLVEDELVLAVPVVPLSPEGDAVDQEWAPPQEEVGKASPFAALAALKKKQ
ncbi:YceD family protein [Stenotrophomonas sp. Marseille-Q4652]|jgi:Predicted metal-binding, possibly nucleic acid-binding protein|uniref:YceD family protein n=1 Tax=Stenotrophomonas sp. Marseille-Q4652 TaxID=2866595 RepID=UPI001CE3CEEE|nr:YceD family protein [Stenotrophomonas sp. Marseille-Q4652]